MFRGSNTTQFLDHLTTKHSPPPLFLNNRILCINWSIGKDLSCMCSTRALLAPRSDQNISVRMSQAIYSFCVTKMIFDPPSPPDICLVKSSVFLAPFRSDLPEVLRQICFYLPEVLRQIPSYLPEVLRQIPSYLPEVLQQITSSLIYGLYGLNLPNNKCKILSRNTLK